MKTEYKWIATRGHGVGVGFFTKREAQIFASRENRRHGSGYYVMRVADISNAMFI